MSSRACSSSSTAPRRCARPSATSSASTRRSSAASATRSETCSLTCPSATAPLVRRRLRAAWALDDHDRALDQLRMLADELARSHPGAAASLSEGLEETLTVTRLGVRGRLKRTLASTNPCESMIETVRRDRAQRQALAVRRHVPALDGRRHARSPSPVPARSSATATSPSSPSTVERDVAAKRAAEPAFTRPSRPRRRRSPLHPPEIIHSEDRRRSSTTNGTSSADGTLPDQCPRPTEAARTCGAPRAPTPPPCRRSSTSSATASSRSGAASLDMSGGYEKAIRDTPPAPRSSV